MNDRGYPVDGPRSWYVLGLLSLSYALAYVDRQLLNLVVDPVKHTLSLTDTQFSYVQGFAFISAYVLAAPFFGRLVDITSRRNVLVFGVCMWSVCTALCGTADTFWELAAMRFGVGVSEACVYPVAMSMIPELFSTRRLPRAFSLFTLGGQIGSGFSLLAGGAVIAFAASLILWFPMFEGLEVWQIAFVTVGLPGLIVAVVLFTVCEPRRHTVQESASADQPYSFRESMARIWEKRSFYFRIYGWCGLNGIVFLSVPAWYPTYLIRVHHALPADVGFRVGLTTLLLGSAGTLLGPWVAQRLLDRGYVDAHLRAAAFASVGTFLFCAAIPFAPDATTAIVIVGGITFFGAFPTANVAFAVQRATPGRMRGMVASLYTLCAQTIGYGIGPTAIAMTTDRVFGDPMKVGNSIQIICCSALFVVLILLVTNLPHYRRMIAEAA